MPEHPYNKGYVCRMDWRSGSDRTMIWSLPVRGAVSIAVLELKIKLV